ncbi:AAA family ATPase [Streptomyces marincola]|uniref:AAA family ATPase n=1 Tax=Streptomyces marincola TaxID=2878388 RepID=UPI0038506602
MQFLVEQGGARLDQLLGTLALRVPQLERVATRPLDDGRLLLQLKDAPFDDPVQSRWASDGTLTMLSYLVVLHAAELPSLVGIGEPEKHLYPALLPELAEKCRAATERSQVIVSTHAPFFVNGIRADELRILHRERDGYTRAFRVSDSERVRAMLQSGAALGDLWMEGHFDVGDPLSRRSR